VGTRGRKNAIRAARVGSGYARSLGRAPSALGHDRQSQSPVGLAAAGKGCLASCGDVIMCSMASAHVSNSRTPDVVVGQEARGLPKVAAYDAYIIEGAIQQKCPILALDRGLAHAARGARIEVVEVGP